MLQLKFGIGLAISILLISGLRLQKVQGADCVVCDSNEDKACITDLSQFKKETCAGECFTKIDDKGVVTRGCQPEGFECSSPKCVPCSDCNICKACDSSNSNDCAQTDASDDSFNAICGEGITKCVMKIKDDKNIERRCATKDDDLAKCTGATCSLCEGGNCNVGIFPSNRRRCYECKSSSENNKCSDVEANKDDFKSKLCKLYDANEKCYTVGSKPEDMQRGCLSSASDNTCAEADNKCVTCNLDDCNHLAYERKQALKCLQCNGTEDANCKWGQNIGQSKECSKKILFNDQEKCYSQVKDEKVYRGCYYERDATALGECKTEDGTCSVCSDSDGCNNKDMGVFSCIRCRSDEEEKCGNQATELTGSACRNPVTQDTAKCFAGVWNNVVIRGCYVDASDRMKYVCSTENNANSCEVCNTKDCNTKKSAAARFSISVLAVLTAVLLSLNKP